MVVFDNKNDDIVTLNRLDIVNLTLYNLVFCGRGIGTDRKAAQFWA